MALMNILNKLKKAYPELQDEPLMDEALSYAEAPEGEGDEELPELEEEMTDESAPKEPSLEDELPPEDEELEPAPKPKKRLKLF
jgi:hypothetical protein